MKIKSTFILFLFTFSLQLFAQDQKKYDGEIEIQLIRHDYYYDIYSEPTKKISNKENLPFLKMTLNSSGQALKVLLYGKYYKNDLHLLRQMHLLEYYKNGNRKRREIWETDKEENLEYNFYVKYEQDKSKKHIISEKSYFVKSDSLFRNLKYWINEKGEFQGRKKDDKNYTKMEYDEEGRLMLWQNFKKGKKNWEWRYSYEENKRIGLYYNMHTIGKVPPKKEIKSFNEKKQVVELENSMYKTTISYDKNGIIQKIEYFKKDQELIESVKFIEIKLKSKKKIKKKSVSEINETIFQTILEYVSYI
ncbi:hypothetical protein [Aureivirga marina]|uniref:hypothetical protein n=1 Tax=Aureivirga marina TaxID=1182451 RepID=UPI0018CA3663|nr:hypothetical protein [Aureivirga marina]